MRDADRVSSKQNVEPNTHTEGTNHLRAIPGQRHAMPAAHARGRTRRSASPHRLKKTSLTSVSLRGLPFLEKNMHMPLLRLSQRSEMA